MPLTVDNTIHIDAPVERVYDFANEAENQTTIYAPCHHFEADSEELQVGTRIRMISRYLGRDLEGIWECTEVVPYRRQKWRAVESIVGATSVWKYEEEDGGTRLSLHHEIDSLGGWKAPLGDRIMTWLYQRDFDNALAEIKAATESQN